MVSPNVYSMKALHPFQRDNGDSRSILAGDISVSLTGKILLYNCRVFDCCRNRALPNVTAHREGCKLSVYVQVPFVGRTAETSLTKGALTGNVDIVFAVKSLLFVPLTSSMFHNLCTSATTHSLFTFLLFKQYNTRACHDLK